jgi:ribosomal protein S18 acetylase RimI-like enzyme
MRAEADGTGGVALRRAEPGDAMAVAMVHVRSWQVGYRALLPEEYLASLRPEDRAARYRFDDPAPERPSTVVATRQGRVVGFATFGPARDDDLGEYGELYALYVHPEQWGRAVGRTLIRDARRRLAGQGRTAALLWVLVGNDRAQRFYRIDGWLPEGSRRQVEVYGVAVDEVRYARALR